MEDLIKKLRIVDINIGIANERLKYCETAKNYENAHRYMKYIYELEITRKKVVNQIDRIIMLQSMMLTHMMQKMEPNEL